MFRLCRFQSLIEVLPAVEAEFSNEHEAPVLGYSNGEKNFLEFHHNEVIAGGRRRGRKNQGRQKIGALRKSAFCFYNQQDVRVRSLLRLSCAQTRLD